MRLDIVGYVLVYLAYLFISYFWLTYTFRIKFRRFLLGSFLSSLVFLAFFNTGFFITAAFNTSLGVQYLGAALFTLIFGGAIFLIGGNKKTKSLELFSNDEEKPKSLKFTYKFSLFFVSLVGIFLTAKQYSSPQFLWDEIIYWVPRMKEIALGHFATTLNTGFGSYPPFWMITGAHALRINDNFLYLLPVFFLIHLFLAITDFIYYRSTKKQGLVAYLIFLPSMIGFYIMINTLQIYSNFFVAILLSGVYFLDLYKDKFRAQITITALMVGAVLSRSDIIVFVGIWYLVNLLYAFKRSDRLLKKFYIVSGAFVVLSFITWTVYYQVQGVENTITSYTVAGLHQAIQDPSTLGLKFAGVINYILGNLMPFGVWWYVPLYVCLLFFNKESKNWRSINILCLIYLVLQYLTVPIDKDSTIQWWLTTGFFRMFGNFSLWLFLDMIIRVSEMPISFEVFSDVGD